MHNGRGEHYGNKPDSTLYSMALSRYSEELSKKSLHRSAVTDSPLNMLQQGWCLTRLFAIGKDICYTDSSRRFHQHLAKRWPSAASWPDVSASDASAIEKCRAYVADVLSAPYTRSWLRVCGAGCSAKHAPAEVAKQWTQMGLACILFLEPVRNWYQPETAKTKDTKTVRGRTSLNFCFSLLSNDSPDRLCRCNGIAVKKNKEYIVGTNKQETRRIVPIGSEK